MTEISLISLNIKQVGELRLEGGTLGHRIADAVQMWPVRDQDPTVLETGYGRLIWQGPADQTQVVIVGKAGAVRACEAGEIDPAALSEMIECLGRRGYVVTKRRD
ncbi:hypothetical protein ASG52_19870 [Methylobacterium sp. Leaf456]|uniref:hypothetical protein n=1 Tax=Methylobacterium sp. Leaf456 TaxID=1736382 RepID=UPI0006F6F210|nr:hypothetical protein [Methylobacterium sp. Leaf456]KQT59986.1 hypothetical protein ASG52_19870 [Methylobacterium sp. Leaf456]